MSRPLRIRPRENAEASAIRTRLAAREHARALKPVLRGRLNDIVQIEKIGDPLAHHRRAEKALAAGFLTHRDRFFGDIQDLVDHHAHTAVAVVEDDHLHRIGRLAPRRARPTRARPAATRAGGCGSDIAPPGIRPRARSPTAGIPPAGRPGTGERPGVRRNRPGTGAAAAARCPLASSAPPPRAPAHGIPPAPRNAGRSRAHPGSGPRGRRP